VNASLESSAALRDLLEGDGGAEVREAIRKATRVATSRVTLAEVGRVLARLRVLDPASAARVARREAEWLSNTELWFVHPIDERVRRNAEALGFAVVP
jgi:predicted nucleic acid-binding protein